MENTNFLKLGLLVGMLSLASSQNNRVQGPGNIVYSGSGNRGSEANNRFNGKNNQVKGDRNSFRGDGNQADGYENDIEGDVNRVRGN